MTIHVRAPSSFALEDLIDTAERQLSPVSPKFEPNQLRTAASAAGLFPAFANHVEFAVDISSWIAALDRRRKAHPFQAVRPSDRVLAMLAIATAEVWRIERDARSQLHEKGNTEIRSFIDAREILRHGLSLRSSEAIESIIDGFSYIVVDALHESKKKKPLRSGNASSLEEHTSQDLIEYVNFSTTYRTLLELWQQVLFRGLDIRRNGGGWSIEVPHERAVRSAVGETRKYQQTAHEIAQFLLSPRKAPIGIPQKRASQFKLDRETWTFRSDPLPNGAAPRYHEDMARLTCALHSWVGALADIPITESGPCCRDLLEVWFALRELAASFLENSMALDGMPPSWPLSVEKATLEAHLQDVLPQAQHVSHCIDLLTHDSELLTELYGHPLMPLETGKLTLFVPGLLHADFERVVVRWLARYLGSQAGSSTYDEKGNIYESRVRKQFRAAASRAALSATWKVEPDAIHFAAKNGGGEREFDLLVLAGHHLFVGEVKCSYHPADPREIADRENLIDGAVRQVQDQVAWVRTNWARFRNRVQLPLPAQASDCMITPFVVVDGCYGSGFAVNDVPVIDGVEFCQFIMSNTWPPAPATGSIMLYKDLSAALGALPSFLSDPPIVAIARSGTQSRTLKFDDPLIPSPITFKDEILSMSRSDDDLRKAFEEVRRRLSN